MRWGLCGLCEHSDDDSGPWDKGTTRLPWSQRSILTWIIPPAEDGLRNECRLRCIYPLDEKSYEIRDGIICYCTCTCRRPARISPIQRGYFVPKAIEAENV